LLKIFHADIHTRDMHFLTEHGRSLFAIIARLQKARFPDTMHAIVNIALKAARDASEVLAHNSDRLDRIKVVQEINGQAITNMEMDAEKTILFHLQKAYPDYSVQSRVTGLLKGRDHQHVWLIDPLCGSANYMRGISNFCVSIALSSAGKINHAVLVNPMLREEFTASRGNGAKSNTQRLRVSQISNLERGLVSLGTDPANAEHGRLLLGLQRNLQELQCDTRISGCPALDLAWVAAGRTDAGWLGENDPAALAAAILILQESGALISDSLGSPEISSSAEFIFGNPKCFKQLLQIHKAAKAVSD
jgi:myo-inositol-1(or 4)-monophosphatase